MKAHDLVLVHGLCNTHRWGRRFLERALAYWGSNRTFVIYLNPSMRVREKHLRSGTIVCIGDNNFRAGTDSIEAQTQYLARKIEWLQRHKGRRKPFDVIAHSMGGLVVRRYMASHPRDVAALVTLGTPHHGSPMANDFRWLGRMLSAQEAFANLTPEWLATFHEEHPVPEAIPIYTVRGFSKRGWNWGVFGELLLGDVHLRRRHQLVSDGLVPASSALLEGATHIGDVRVNHLGLARHPDIVDLCATYLP